MKILDDLKENLDEIEEKSDSDHRFVSNMITQREEHPEKKFTGPQFKYLCDCHNRYCRGW